MSADRLRIAKRCDGPAISIGQCDRVDMSSVIGLVAVPRAAIAVASFDVGIGAAADVLNLPDAGGRQPRLDIAREIEHGVAVLRARREEARVRGAVRLEAFDEFRAYFVVRLPDHRAGGS